MKKELDISDVIIKERNPNTVTIARNQKKTRNQTRDIKTPEIVVNCFSDAEITHLRGIDIPTISFKKKSVGWQSVIGKYIPNVFERNFDKLKSSCEDSVVRLYSHVRQ